MATLTTHVLDTARGCPAAGLVVRLYRAADRAPLTEKRTDADGRIRGIFLNPADPADYRLVFLTEEYFRRHDLKEVFFREVVVAFHLDGEAETCHVPLLLSPFGYSTYRGS